jgi:hypothetical protein
MSLEATRIIFDNFVPLIITAWLTDEVVKWERYLIWGPQAMYGNRPSKQTYTNFVKTVFLLWYIKQQNGGGIKSIFIPSRQSDGSK